MSEAPPGPPQLKKDARYWTGMSVLVAAMVSPLLALGVPTLGLSTAQTALLCTLLTVGTPEVMMVVAAALLGKSTMDYYLHRLYALFKKPWLDPVVPRWRYNLGLAVMVLSLAPHYTLAYMPGLLAPHDPRRIWALAGADLVFLLSFFVVGGEFWDKLSRLFTWEGAAYHRPPNQMG